MRHYWQWQVLVLVLTAPWVQASPNALDDASAALWRQGFIKGLMAATTAMESKGIEVRVQGATAELSGEVSSLAERALAEQLALSADGIDAVANRLQVRTPRHREAPQAPERHRLSSVTINNKVMSRVLAHKETRGLPVEVKTYNRSVTISGTVPSTQEKELLYWLVKNTEGVTEVIDNVEVGEALVQQDGF